MNFNKGSKLIVASAIVLIVLLFFAPKKPWSDKTETNKTEVVKSLSNVELSSGQKKELDSLNELLQKVSDNSEKLKLLQQVTVFWKKMKSPVDVAQTLNTIAEINPSADAWILAGEEFYRSTQFVQEDVKALIYQNAITMFDKALKIDPNNEKAKIKKGVCIVELGSDPMAGISLLREVAEKNPKNIEAQLNLGFLSVRSNQYDKAIERFEKVIAIDSNYSDAYIYLANTYEMKHDTGKALINYERYIKTSNDTMGVSQVRSYIKRFTKN